METLRAGRLGRTARAPELLDFCERALDLGEPGVDCSAENAPEERRMTRVPLPEPPGDEVRRYVAASAVGGQHRGGQLAHWPHSGSGNRTRIMVRGT